jgi:hypothetical protein
MPPPFDPSTVNLAELQTRLSMVPFVPFRIVVSSGKSYDVPTRDHIAVLRLSRRVFVEFDDLTGAYINSTHITAIEPRSPSGA